MSRRIASIDLVRGIVMVLMVLDHARDFFVDTSVRATDLEQTYGALFFTRWVTHFCAPAFVMLAGTSIFLLSRRRSPAERTRFLVSRGLFLVVLELTIVKLGWAPEPFYYFLILQVIWAIGWSMVLMAAFAYLPARVVAGAGALALVLSPLWENAGDNVSGVAGIALTLLTGHGHYEPAEGHLVIVGYAVLPWLAVMMVGFGVGELATLPRERFAKLTSALGVTLTLAFIAVRSINLYGDPEPWTTQRAVLSFLNTTKYPPSLLFLLMTLGPVFVALSLLSKVDETKAPWRWLLVFGRVPLFFYVAHLWLLRLTSIVCALILFGVDALMPPPEGHAGNPSWPLFAGYVAWGLAVLTLYRPSRWYADLKRRRDDWWLSYL